MENNKDTEIKQWYVKIERGVNEASEVKKDAFKEVLSIDREGKGKVSARIEPGVTRQDLIRHTA